MPINTRTDLDRLLSNLHLLDEPIPGPLVLLYPTVEHAYVAAKYEVGNEQWPLMLSKLPVTPGNPSYAGMVAKQKSKLAKLPQDWESRKQEIMFTLLLHKFVQPRFKTALLSTGQEFIYEAGDPYWGTGRSGNGPNNLGLMLMLIRESMR